jgi:hypothetical protein
MPALSYRQRVDVYRKANDESSPENWVLVAEQVAANFTILPDRDALAAGALYNPLPTHRGRCEYSTHVQAGRDARLLVDRENDRQYLVLRADEGDHVYGGHGELRLMLHRLLPPATNLVKV